MSKKVVVIGGGIAGMESAAYLTAMGYYVTIIEKESKLGGHLLNWERLFPSKRLGSEVLEFLSLGIRDKVNVLTSSEVENIEKTIKTFKITLKQGSIVNADAILITTGYETFDATKKEEYGYGIYDNVITSADLEKMLLETGKVLTPSGKVPSKIGFVHCVGSRDEKVGNIYCSRVCCITGVKQAVEVKEKIPEVDVYCFYMDLRMYGRHFEELFKESQKKWGVNFIRGRLSEACENADGSIMIKAEDTLAGKPIRMNVDLLVLLVGFVPSEGTKTIARMLDINLGSDGFITYMDEHTMSNDSNVPGIFMAGTCTGPKTIGNTITDARAAAAKVASYLEEYEIEERLVKKTHNA